MQLRPPRTHLTLGRVRSYRFLGLLVALLLLLITSTFVGHDSPDRSALGLLFAIVLFAAGGAASTRRQERWVAAALALASSIILVGGLMLEHRAIYLPGLALFTAFLAYTIHAVLTRMVSAPEIDADILCGAAAIYLLIGVAWAVTYWMIYEFDATAFTSLPKPGGPPLNFQDFGYYSLSCLTGLGIADMTPVNPFARIWTTLEPITGNLYIAVLVSRLVGLYR